MSRPTPSPGDDTSDDTASDTGDDTGGGASTDTGVAVVTDSTACLPLALARAADVQVVPLQVVVGGHTFAEGVDIGPTEVAAALRRRERVTTSRPTPSAFLYAYTRAADAGARSIVSVHLAAEMSGTYESAVLAARESPVPTEVVDSRTLGMGLGYLALHAAALSARGTPLGEVARSCRERGAGTRVLFYVATLEHLRR
ncbi:MAG TPA: DegV family protein, partial [Actinomycetales bacterium]